MWNKRKSTVFYVRRQAAYINSDLQNLWLTQAAPRTIPGTTLTTEPGIFSWKKLDAGSVLLIESLKNLPICGTVADLGAGYGFLSHELLDQHPEITSIELFEAEKLALNNAKINLRSFHVTKQFHWCDVTEGAGRNCFDVIVSNPPFHEGDKTDVELGRAFLRSACDALRSGGVFYLVANRHLPYEKQLQELFPSVESIGEDNRYKVLTARKR